MTRAYASSLGRVRQLHNLRTFVVVADAGGVKLAAAQLLKTTSGITRGINALERSVGAPLFERKPHGLVLNERGKAILLRARRIHEEISAATEEFLNSTRKCNRPLSTDIDDLLFNERKLELIVHLANLQSITSTAIQLKMTQAGASMALCRIEAVMGQPLFKRELQGMVAAGFTDRLVVRARRVFIELHYMQSEGFVGPNRTFG